MTPEDIKSARKQLGLTQAELAAWLELSGKYAARTVRSWEAGEKPISGPARVAIRAFLAGFRPTEREDPPADPR